MSAVFAATFALLSVAGLLTVARLALGPSTLDRVAALDTLAVLIVAGLAVDAARTGTSPNTALLITVALLGFVGSVAAARFIERGPP